MIVDLDELDLGELLEIQHQRAGDRVQRPIRLAIPGQVKVHTAIRKLHFAIAGKTIIDHRKSLVSLHIAGTFEEFIEHRLDDVP